MDNEHDIPDGEETAEKLSPLAILIRQAFEHGSQEARAWFAQQGKHVEPSMFANMTRYCALQYLTDRKQTLVDYVQENLNNNGIGVICSGCHIRVFKAQGARVPQKAGTRKLRAFLSQMVQPSLFSGLDDFEDALAAIHANLVLLWSVDRKYRIDKMWLVMPTSATRSRVRWHWQVELPNPILAMDIPRIEETEVDSYADLDDEIQLPDDGEDETRQAE